MKNHLFMLLGALFLTATTAYAQPKPTTVTGKLLKKTWAKTLESYCTQVSDYYVLSRPKKKEMILSLDADVDAPMFDNWVNKKVQVQGEWVNRTITPNPQSQHPVTPKFPNAENENATQCKIFHVTNIRLAKQK
ncbi:MAG: hypothetical protein J0L94_12755 [Rhodothermia bacterium]|nr:hypothetical protein [Rhodothermia bacterium]